MKSLKVLIIVMCLSLSMDASSLKNTILVSAAGGAICKNYAEEVGGNVKAFSEMNVVVMKVAEKMDYTNNFQDYISKVDKIKTMLQNQLFNKYNSKLDIYNNWCIKFYKGYQKGINKAIK